MIYFNLHFIAISIFAWELISGLLLTVCLFWSFGYFLTVPNDLLLHLIAFSIFAWELISGLLLTVCLFWSVCHLLTIPIGLLWRNVKWFLCLHSSISWKPLRFVSWFPTLTSCSPNLLHVYIRLCKHENHFTFLL